MTYKILCIYDYTCTYTCICDYSVDIIFPLVCCQYIQYTFPFFSNRERKNIQFYAQKIFILLNFMTILWKIILLYYFIKIYFFFTFCKDKNFSRKIFFLFFMNESIMRKMWITITVLNSLISRKMFNNKSSLIYKYNNLLYY